MAVSSSGWPRCVSRQGNGVILASILTQPAHAGNFVPSQGIMRNRDSQRWDQCQYLLHEKGDYTKVYGAFSWRQDYCIDFRQLPSDLEHEHPLLLFTLSCLVMDQHKKCTKWPAASYEKSGFSQDLTRLSFNVAALQKRAADLLGPRYVPAPQ